jgi:hypothetical protein
MGKELEKSFWKRSFSTMKEMHISNLNTMPSSSVSNSVRFVVRQHNS